MALTANQMYVRADGENLTGYGGTSFAAPLWAGFMALVNQQAAATGQPPIGFLNAALDVIGKSQNYTACFHDITTGNNESPASPARFVAATGFDLCSGWGTPAGQALINALANPEPLIITPTTGFTAAGGVGGPFTATSQVFSLTNIGTNALTWSLSNTSVWLTASATGGTLPVGGAPATVTVSVNANASNLLAGAYSATLWFTNLHDLVGQSRTFNLSIIQPPVITGQPTNETVLEGEPGEFSVTATGGQPLAYQWQLDGTNLVNGGNISGATTSNLIFSAVAAGEAGTITVVITNAAGVAVSSNAALIIPQSPPVFTLQPTNETAYATEYAEFAVTVVGTAPCFYQWSFNSNAIPGATNAILYLNDLQQNQAGVYSVVATNSVGETESANALLTVLPAPPCASIPGMIAWWAADGNAGDSVGTNNGTLVGSVTYVPGEVGLAFSVNDGDYVSIPNSAAMDALTTNMTVEAWIKVASFSSQDWISMVCKGDTSWQLRRYNTNSYLSFWTKGLNNPELIGVRNVNDGQWHHVAGTYDGTNKYLYVDGTLDAATNASGAIISNTDPLLIGDNPEALERFFDGSIDAVSLYNRALTAGEVQAIYRSGSLGKCPIPISIVYQPTNEFIVAGSCAAFSVVATGSQPLSYQWYFDGSAIGGATNTSLIFSNAQSVNAGVYSVVVANTYDIVQSSNVTLTVVTEPPTIIDEPASETNNAGAVASFSVIAAGAAPLAYQWSLNLTNLAGATNATLTISNIQPNQAGNYSVRLTNSFGSITSSNAQLTVLTQPPVITSQPVGATNYAGTTASFTVVAVGTLPLSYQWYFNSTNLAGATNATLTLSNIQPIQGGVYAVGISGPYGSVMSSNVTLTVLVQPPAIISQPVSVTNYAGSTAAFTVVAAGTAPLSYLWYLNSTNLAGATNSTLSLTNIQPREAGVYAVTVTNPYGSIASSNVQLTVLVLPPSISTQPVSQTNVIGTTASFGVVAVGTAPLFYQWNFGGTNMAGQTNSTLTLTNVQFAEAGNYSVAVTNLYGATNSAVALLVVEATPSCDPPPPNIVGWWPGQGNTNDVIGGDDGILVNGVSYVNGEVGEAFSFNGSDYVLVPDSPTLDALTTNMTVEAWIQVSAFSSQDWISMVCKGDTAWQLRRYATGSTMSFYTAGTSVQELAGSRNINDGKWHHVAGVYNGTNKFLYVDGTLDASTSATGPIGTNNDPLLFGDNPTATERYFDGAIDAVSVYSRALSSAEIAAIYNAGSAGKCSPAFPPGIIGQPTNQAVVEGGQTAFAVTATGTGPLSYQWSLNAAPISGATNATLVLTNIQLAQAGDYSVLITNIFGATNSAAAVLTVSVHCHPVKTC